MTENFKNIKAQILKYNIFVQSFFFNILCVLFFQLICEIHFDTDTDQFINHILSGVYGFNASAHGWIPIYTGYILKTLYSVFAPIPWYALTQYFCIFISLVLLTNIVFKTNLRWGGYAANFLIFILIGYECYARTSYIKTGVLCVSVASFTFYQMCCKRIQKNIYLILGTILFLVGYLWWNMSLFFGLFLLIPCIYRLYKRKDLSSFKVCRKCILIGLIIVLCPVLLGAINIFYLKCHPSIEKYIEYRKNLEYINNYGWPDFDEYSLQYDKWGISENTYYLLANNEFVDSYIVEPDTLIKVREIVNKPTISISDFLKFTRLYPIRYFDTGLFIGFLILLVLFFLSGVDKKTTKMIYLFCGAGIFYYICYLIGVDDVAVIRTSIWMAAIISILGFSYNINVEVQELKPYYSAVITIAMVILITQKISAITQMIDESYINSTTEWMELVKGDSSKIHVMDNTDFYQKDMPFQSLEKSSLDNILISKFPYTLYNSRELIDVLNHTDEMYFLSEKAANRTANYINERYEMHYYSVQIKNIHDIAFYMLRNATPIIDKTSIKTADSDIVSNLNLVTLESGNKAINGSVYKKNSNSFAQKCYIEVHNSEEDSYTFYDVSQTENSSSSDIMNGKYSAIYAEIAPVENGRNEEYAVILEVNGEMYKVPLDD